MTSGRRCEFSLRGDATVAGVGSTWAVLASVDTHCDAVVLLSVSDMEPTAAFPLRYEPERVGVPGENVEQDEYVER